MFHTPAREGESTPPGTEPGGVFIYLPNHEEATNFYIIDSISGGSMHKVILIKYIWTHDEQTVQNMHKSGQDTNNPKVAILSREITLPFPPCIGLNVIEDDWESEQITSITWDNDDQVFRCTVPDSFPRDDDFPPIDYEDLLEMYLEIGWGREQKGGGDAPTLKHPAK